MSGIPTRQLKELYHRACNQPGENVVSKNYCCTVGGGHVRLWHYGTLIYDYNLDERTTKIGGWSVSDRDAINSMSRLTGGDGAYIDDYTLYKTGTGPRYPETHVAEF